MSDFNDYNQLTDHDLMDAEAAGFAAAIGRSDSKARESYIRNWGNIEILQRYEKGFADGFAAKRATQVVRQEMT